MDFREYLHEVTGQIRASTVHEAIERELLTHLENQKEAYLGEGMTEEEAEAAASREMGDPVEVGLALDAVHRPAAPGKYVLVFMVFQAICIFINLADIFTWPKEDRVQGILGLILIILVCTSVTLVISFAEWPGVLERPLGIAFEAYLIADVLIEIFALYFSGDFYHRRQGLTYGDGFSLMLIFFLIYLNIIFMERKAKRFCWGTVLVAFILQIVLLLLLWENPAQNALPLLESFFMSAFLVTAAARRGWYIKKSRALPFIEWAIFVAVFIIEMYRLCAAGNTITGSAFSANHLPADSFLKNLSMEFGSVPVFLVFVMCALFLLYLCQNAYRATNEWSRLFFLAASAMWGVSMLNSILACFGILTADFVFAPFLWNILSATGEMFTDSLTKQMFFCYVLFGYIIRFRSRDSLLNLEIGRRSQKEKKTAEKR